MSIARRRLILFDIDCTLIDTGGAGMAALQSAARAYFRLATGRSPLELDLAGSTDSGIVRQIFTALEHVHDAVRESAFYEIYLKELEANLHGGFAAKGRVLPGVRDLLDTLEGHRARPALGLLTGNIARGAEIKIRHFQLDRFFPFGAFGDDHHDRNELGAVALRRAAERHGAAFEAVDTVVVGDTPKDITCARAFGARVVAVATGRFSREELEAMEPDASLDDLSDLARTLEAIGLEG